MDRYEKGVQLGKGTFATVYKGRDKQVSVEAVHEAEAAVAACKASLCVRFAAAATQTNQTVALKIIHPGDREKVGCRSRSSTSTASAPHSSTPRTV